MSASPCCIHDVFYVRVRCAQARPRRLLRPPEGAASNTRTALAPNLSCAALRCVALRCALRCVDSKTNATQLRWLRCGKLGRRRAVRRSGPAAVLRGGAAPLPADSPTSSAWLSY